ncbi:MAG: hypothetical protein ABF808_06490, partial [Oenococcus sp.]
YKDPKPKRLRGNKKHFSELLISLMDKYNQKLSDLVLPILRVQKNRLDEQEYLNSLSKISNWRVGKTLPSDNELYLLRNFYLSLGESPERLGSFFSWLYPADYQSHARDFFKKFADRSSQRYKKIDDVFGSGFEDTFTTEESMMWDALESFFFSSSFEFAKEKNGFDYQQDRGDGLAKFIKKGIIQNSGNLALFSKKEIFTNNSLWEFTQPLYKILLTKERLVITDMVFGKDSYSLEYLSSTFYNEIWNIAPVTPALVPDESVNKIRKINDFNEKKKLFNSLVEHKFAEKKYAFLHEIEALHTELSKEKKEIFD